MNRVAGLLALLLIAPTGPAAAQFQALRYDDDFVAQRQACGESGGPACWKALPLAEGIRLSVGGELRWRHEYTRNPGYGADPQDRWGALLQRHALFADLRLGGHWRGFAQLGSSWANGRAGGPSPVDANRLDPRNLFVEWNTAVRDDGGIGLRAGIQELRLGSARLVDARDGPNVRRSFDAIRGYVERGAWRVDAFTAAPRVDRPGAFDDARSRDQALRGIHATRSIDGTGWDAYLLHYEDRAAQAADGIAHERRWTLGTRAFGTREHWDWNWEMALQGGRFGNEGIRAWTIATETGRTFDDHAWRPRLALLAAVASGDGAPGDARHGTFNPMYPRGNYFGEEATLGPRNFFNFHPALTIEPRSDVALNLGVDLFWRQRVGDGVYAPNGRLLRAPGASRARHVASIVSFSAEWTPTPEWSASVVAAYLRPGRFLRETGAHQSLGYLELTTRYRF